MTPERWHQVTELFHAAYEHGVAIMPTGTMALSTPMTPDVVEQIAEQLTAALVSVRE